MTVPIYQANVSIQDQLGENKLSLCYEIHGEAGSYFNLVSDGCTSVNARYAQARPGIDLNIIDRIAVRAVPDGGGDCPNIAVTLSDGMCAATVLVSDFGIILRPGDTYDVGGINVRAYPNRVRISVPNCADRRLVMWIFCLNGTLEDPVTWEMFDVSMIRFVIARGFNLAESSHGLIGMFLILKILLGYDY